VVSPQNGPPLSSPNEPDRDDGDNHVTTPPVPGRECVHPGWTALRVLRRSWDPTYVHAPPRLCELLDARGGVMRRKGAGNR
jgi:hypothetical protein